MQSSSDQFKDLLGGLAPVYIVLSNCLARLTVTLFRRLTWH